MALPHRELVPGLFECLGTIDLRDELPEQLRHAADRAPHSPPRKLIRRLAALPLGHEAAVLVFLAAAAGTGIVTAGFHSARKGGDIAVTAVKACPVSCSTPSTEAARACGTAGCGEAYSSPSNLSATKCSGMRTRSSYVAPFFNGLVVTGRLRVCS